MNIHFERKLPIPKETKELYPLTKEIQKIIKERQEELKAIFEGKIKKCVLIIGPCSADNSNAVLDYCLRLAKIQEQVKENLYLIPRVYTSKPRTLSDGYMGILHQPKPQGNADLFQGIIAVRSLHSKVIAETGLTAADELLYPENYKYVDDLLGYVSVGARSVEDQQHRFTASGIDVPVGMKNPTSGDLTLMMNGIYAAQHPHDFIYRGWAAHSLGNPLAHGVLRGYTDKSGKYYANYQAKNILLVKEFYEKMNLKNPAIIIDCNHANSGKDPFKQQQIMQEVLASRKENLHIAKIVKGFMVESYLQDGNQNEGGKVYGKSITDACLGWEKTEKLIFNLAENLEKYCQN